MDAKHTLTLHRALTTAEHSWYDDERRPFDRRLDVGIFGEGVWTKTGAEPTKGRAHEYLDLHESVGVVVQEDFARLYEHSLFGILKKY